MKTKRINVGEPTNIEKNETSLTCIIYPGFEIIVSHQILPDDELILLEGYFFTFRHINRL